MTFRMGPIYIIQGEHGPDLMWIRLNDAPKSCFIHGDASRDAHERPETNVGWVL